MSYFQPKATQRTRDLQLKSLFEKFPDAKAVDSSQYNTIIQIPQMLNQFFFTFELLLPQNFPSVRPRIMVKCPVVPRSSKYVLGNGEVAHQKLDTWGVNSSLNQVILDIFRDMTREGTIKPQQISKIQLNENILGSNPSNGNPQQLGSHSRQSSYSLPQSQSQPVMQAQVRPQPKKVEAQLQFPAIPSEFEQLNTLTIPELQRLLSDEEAFKAFYLRLPFVDTITSFLNDVENENLKTAKEKVDRDKSLIEMTQTLDAKIEELKNLEAKHKMLLEERKKIDARYSPNNILAKLDDLIDESELECETITKNYALDQDISSYVKSFLESRTKYHLRKLKRNRFASQYVNNRA